MPYQMRKQRTRNWLKCLFGLVLLAGAGLACGGRVAVPYPETFRSTGQCQAEGAVRKGAEEAALAAVFNSGANSTICILRANDGVLLKHYDLMIHGDVIGQSQGLLYLNERGGDDGQSIGLCAIHLSDGQQLWCQPQINAYSFFFVQDANGVVYVSALKGNGNDGSVFALSEANGRLLWKFRTRSDLAHLLIDHGTVYVSTSSDICALQGSLGSQLWCVKLAVPRIDGMAVDGQLYVRTAADNTNNSDIIVYALKLTTGAIRWKISLGSSESVGYKQILAADGIVYVNVHSDVSDDLLYALNAVDGKQSWMTTITMGMETLVATHSTLYVGAEGGEGVTALRVGDGSRLWHYPLPWGEVGPSSLSRVQQLVISNQMIYALVAVENSLSILALSMQNGSAEWQDSACGPGAGSGSFAPLPSPVGTLPRPPTHCYWAPQRMLPTMMSLIT